MQIVTLYTRKECKLCDEVKDHLVALNSEFPHRLAEVDIDSDPALQKTYGQKIPVVEIGPYTLIAPITKEHLRMTLAAATDRHSQLQRVGGEAYEQRVRRGLEVSGADRFSFWLSKHYLAVVNLLLLIYIGLPFLAPVFMKEGDTLPARVIYTVYSPLCHQFGFRSFFLFGEQAYYPLPEAGVQGVKTFDQVTGIQDLANPSSYSRLEARNYVGNPTVGYKVALCERDVAIYLSMLLFGLIFGLTGRRLKPLHWAIWVFLAVGPIGLDGFSQLFSQFNFPWLTALLPYRESTPFLRVLTGSLFGFGTGWFAIPYMEETMAETRQFVIKKLAGAESK
jgi:uncharacterized membrane protein